VIPIDTPTTCFALLDDAQSTSASSRLYTNLIATLCCDNAEDWQQFWQETQRHLQQGHHAVALLSYETGAALHALEGHPNSIPSRILIFADCALLTPAEVTQWLDAQSRQYTAQPAGIANLSASVDEAQCHADIARIREYIAAGDTYQVNYTFRLHFEAYGEPLALYQHLRARQPVPFGALICLPDGEAILSLSPELFVRHQSGKLIAKPMKGTAAATGDVALDQASAQALASDVKNRAENLMIVDLLRNDLGRVAESGSVKVERLFEVERFSGVLQMTSTISATARADADIHALIDALYPCGSITGAPKHRTMQIIRELENEPRGIYTGAIGWFDPPTRERSVGDFCLSVPIRTLHLQASDTSGLRTGSMGVGAGIVFDSDAASEYAECQLKAQFLTGLAAEFELFETIHATREQCRHLDLHLARLQNSAAYFGFHYDLNHIKSELEQHQNTLLENTEYRLKLSLNNEGKVSIQSAVLTPLNTLFTTPIKALIAKGKTQRNDIFLQHKTTHRSRYDQAWKSAEQQGAFDMIFFNEEGKLTEGGRTNVFVHIDNQWFTPPLSDGVLPGVMRSVLLADPALRASERSLTKADLQAAQKVILCNALRGAFEVYWER
jgi:para-aminobenzoate synthetase / 4-amino-4-deoxychorismate lyase